MANIKITKTTVEAIAPTDCDQIFWDATLKGFGLKVTPAGSRVYLVQYRTGGGRSGVTKRVTIGKHGSPWTPDMARTEAKEVLARVTQGSDPAKAKQLDRQMLTVAELCDKYLQDGTGTKKASTLSTDKGRIMHHIKPLIGKLKLTDVTQAHIKKFIKNVAEGATAADVKTKLRGRAIVRGGKGTATRTVGLLGGILTYAVELELLAANPVKGVKRYPDKSNERFLSAAELGKLGAELRHVELLGVNPKAIAIIRLLVFTGARRGEIERLRWPEVDLPRSRLRLDDSKTGQKSIPLNGAALAILTTLREASSGKGFVFPAAKGEGHYVGTPRIWSSLRKRIGLSGVRLHDLRHSFASVGVTGGTSLMIVGALLGHRDHATTLRYAHLAADPVSTAAEDIGALLEKALNSVVGVTAEPSSGELPGA
ncbi:site-specific integrase [Mesorhizobium sp.]|uniref:tyrosine-type recombinase/integrase n=1 Tax=Mesorhizobium sp. TaxID=1871066 RepID=UPI000FE47D05|nr:site-specific integrase [Mesorhizobium sp.]RWO81029.1 MAG: site-specific integrase [Mesorhizobium sp.]